MYRRVHGFTLIELMVAISIVAVTFGVVISSAAAARKNARDAQRQTDLRTLQAALQQFYADQNYFPDSITLSSAGVLNQCTTNYSGCSATKIYLNPTPVDPTGSPVYLYRSALDAATKTTACSSGSNNRSCHFYFLCAKLEGTSPQQPSQYADCATYGTYNFQITP